MSLQNTLDKLTLDDAPAGGVALVYQHGRLVESACSGTAYMLDGAPVAWQPSTLSLNYSVGKGVQSFVCALQGSVSPVLVALWWG